MNAIKQCRGGRVFQSECEAAASENSSAFTCDNMSETYAHLFGTKGGPEIAFAVASCGRVEVRLRARVWEP